MLKYYENDNIIVDTTHNNYPYTYELLNELKKVYKNDEIYLFCDLGSVCEVAVFPPISKPSTYALLPEPSETTCSNR